MSNEIATLLYGAIGGGLVSAGLRLVETYLVAPRLSEAVEARKKLFMYARPLWSACHAVEFRLNMLYEQSSSDQEIPILQLNPKEAKSLDWFTKEGYYVTSTAYLIAAVASWIVLFEQDVVDIARITTIWQDCRQRFGGDGNFLFGEFAIADAMFAPVVLRFLTYDVPLDPVCQTYANTILALPAMQEWLQAAEAEPYTIPAYDR